MSPRAACRLETLGFERVYDYAAGKSDWLARGLTREGEKAAEQRAVDFARTDAVTCGLEEPIAAVRERVDSSPYGFAFVISDTGVLLGRLRRAALDGDPTRRAEEVMEPGPSTVRPDTRAAELRERLESRDLRTAVLTDPDGLLLGIVRTRDLT